MDPLDAIYEAILDGDGNLVEEHTRAALDSGQHRHEEERAGEGW